MAVKKCYKCGAEFKQAFRVRHFPLHHAKKQWVFLCKGCTLLVKNNNNHYQYGGTWKG